jgi:cell wall-associated NlpC family hydrolase
MSEDTGRVHVSVANLYRDPTYGSEVINQALLGELIWIEDCQKDFTRIRLIDDYQGWISNYQWVSEQKNSFSIKKIRKHFVTIYSEPDNDGEPIRDATIGSQVSVVQESNSWSEIVLPDGIHGWIDNNSFSDFPAKSREGVVELVKEFLGYPYHWGGRSSKGFDCSGLIQMVFSLLELQLPRDSWMQQRDGKFVSDKPDQAEPGDLYFFSESGSKISHVGVALGDSRIIHSRGMVRENSLKRDEENFSEELYTSFIDVRTFF